MKKSLLLTIASLLMLSGCSDVSVPAPVVSSDTGSIATGEVKNEVPDTVAVEEVKVEKRSTNVYDYIEVMGTENAPIGKIISVFAFDDATDEDLQGYCTQRMTSSVHQVKFYNSRAGGAENLIGTCFSPNNKFTRI